ncbi:Methanogenic corrinoid protein MtbC1 [Desulfonatronum thiosulfatophilum]|uniref:Methanogenic corrinoid protein MtbC1 n=1 Tax=Desulfonatronum thiosulfatophilum TaxID=617002 RepID=A0A1G6DD76_9BACT|nr:cobalamin-dependent protein [Desulfonatronum thiosulfatophilum]SDB43078.1 Methanogenic corrinoid protein MtbC1 [Desulfonatronum thiosulfatophilum]
MITSEFYDNYLQGLLAGNRQHCSGMVEDLLERNIPVQDLYLDLFQRSMYDVGNLWEENKISVAVEHLATSVTESLLSLVYPIIFSAEHNGKKAIISCVANEYHQIGGKMVADILELHGWDGYFLGANTPVDALLKMIADKQPDLVGLSLSISHNMSSLHAIVDRIRTDFPDLPVIVGGQAFRWQGMDIERQHDRVELVSSLTHLQDYIAEA